MPKIAALVVAAGTGSRAGQDRPKQYVQVAGQPLLRHALLPLLAHPAIGAVRVVIGAGQEDDFAHATRGLAVGAPVMGGATRQQSVFNGLMALAQEQGGAPEMVLIHDAARPFLPADVIDRLLAALKQHDGAIPGLEVVDTIKQVNEHGIITATPPRPLLRAAQTPQAFRFAAIMQAHRRAARMPEVEFSDDASVAEWAGLKVVVVKGDARLRKITHPEDFAWAEEMTGQGGETA